ncbi:hypothetical protein [Ascidiaceihabitans sp.]|uniref:nSTAND3 domain-containing NTPase n=1 Tax=Ascidiaceihabitans sp. TaxID=1872644 RepID=UPI0032984C49
MALEDGSVSMIPEQAGREDATFVWPADKDRPTATLEVQVKGAAGKVDLQTLVEHLLHYPDRKGTGSLIERLMDLKNHGALFVMSARCTDSLTPLLLDRSPQELTKGRPIVTSIAEGVLAAVTSIGEKPLPENVTRLQKDRHADAQKLAARPLSDYSQALAQLAITECETAETVEVRLHRTLQRRRFDTLTLRGILASLTDHLNDAKRSQSDVIPAMRAELERRAPLKVRPVDYLDRGIEADLIKQLQDQRTLLLAGPPRTGKSWTAQRIGGELQQLGFEVAKGSQIDEAERFLTDPISAARMYLLDDPLGAREPLSDGSARLAALRQLIERLPFNRRLIVTQTDSVLMQTRGAPTIMACKIGNHPWRVIPTLSPTHADIVWRSAAEHQKISASKVELVAKIIERNDQLREPGALSYLAQTFDELPSNAGEAEILFQARRDAVDFAKSLADVSPEYRAMLCAAALATGPGQEAAIPELAFVANGGEARPSLADDLGITLGASPRPAPQYSNPPQLDEAQGLAVDNLQRRRILNFRGKGLNFTHPYLRAGAQAVLQPEIPSDLDLLIAQTERSLACANAGTSLATARNLRWLRAAVPPDMRPTILTIAIKGLRSLFPATRDACFALLADLIDELPPKQRNRLPEWADRVSLQLENVDVHDGVGFITDQFLLFAETSPLSDIQPYLDAIDAGEPVNLDLALSRRILLTLELDPEALTAAVCRRLLSADEAVIRATTAGVWLARPRGGDTDILKTLAHDRAPSIGTAILKSVANSWEEIDIARREAVTTTLRSQASSVGCASVLFNQLVLFNRIEHFGETPPWPLFADLMPTVITHLPLSVAFRNGRLNAVLDAALEASPSEVLAPTLEAWAYRLLRRLPFSMLDEYELSIIEPLLVALSPDRRLIQLQNLLGVPDTGARTVTVKWLVRFWDQLVAEEQALLSEALSEERPDAIWLCATVLTSSAPPPVLVGQLCGDTHLFEQDAENIETALGTDLLAACIRMYRGDPQPLWWYGTHRSDNPVWPKIVRAIAACPDHPLFGECFTEVASSGGQGELRDIVDELPETALMQAFDLLLQYKLGCNGFWRDKSWVRLLERAEDVGLLDAMFERIDAVSDGILDHLRDAQQWLGKSRFADRLISLYPRDIKTIVDLHRTEEIFDQIESNGSPDKENVALLMRTFISTQVEKLESEPCRLFQTWDALSRVLKNYGTDQALEERISLGRQEALERHFALQKGYIDVTAEIRLEGWVQQAANLGKIKDG